MRNFYKQAGVTLLEVMLVLAIGAMLLVLGLQQYSQWNKASYVQQLTFNVNNLFQAMATYYKANCADSYDVSGNSVSGSGALSPTSITYPPSTSQAVTVSTLKTKGYLTQWQPLNQLVNQSGSPYVLQFNPILTNRQIYACWNYGTPPSTPTCTTPQPIPTATTTPYPSNVVTWQLQVAVQILDTAHVSIYKAQLLADCISTTYNAGIVTPCSSSSPTTCSGSSCYLVWERMPSFVLSNASFTPTQWQSYPAQKEFQMQYTHDSNYEFNNVNVANTVYYLCGG